MFDWLVNKPNNILERQKLVQADPRPIYYRYPRALLYMRVYGALWTAGLGGTAFAIYSLIKGKSQA